jgi:hypothetical protein
MSSKKPLIGLVTLGRPTFNVPIAEQLQRSSSTDLRLDIEIVELT